MMQAMVSAVPGGPPERHHDPLPCPPRLRGWQASPVKKRVWRLPQQEDDEGPGEGIGRILALSDGVFAIALTLLVLEIAVPATTSDGNLPKVLLGLWPRYLAYALSFLVIARFWVIHHGSFQLIVRYDDALVWLNLLLLLFVAFLPFPTAVLGEHNSSASAAVLYAIAVALVSAASAGYWWYASGKGRLLRPDVGRAQIRAMRARSLSGPVFFTLTVPIAAFLPFVAEALWVFAFPLARIAFVMFYAEEHNQPG
jgi:TMEM175 potassium channel family protein